MAILKRSHLQTATTLDGLQAVLIWFDQFEPLPLPREVWLQCQLALIEGFTNVVRHAHRNLPPETPIKIEVIATTTTLEIKIWDRGPGFDFENTLRHKVAALNPDNEGGRGLSIMGQVADTIQYEKNPEQGNCLHICKQVAPAIAVSP